MRQVKILSDYTPLNDPNYLKILEDDQGDFHLNLTESNDDEMGIRISSSGSRHSQKVKDALRHLMNVYMEEIENTKSEEIKKINNEEW